MDGIEELGHSLAFDADLEQGEDLLHLPDKILDRLFETLARFKSPEADYFCGML